MDVSSAPIMEFLTRYAKARRSRQLLVLGLGLTALLVGGLVWAALLHRLDLPLFWRRLGVVLPIGLIFLWFSVFFGLLPLRRLADARHLARQLESAMGTAERRDLLSAVEFLRGRAQAGVSPSLVRAHIQRVERELAGFHPGALLPRGALRWPLRSMGLALLALLLAWAFLPEHLGPALPSLFQGGASEEAVQVEDSWIAEIQLHYRYPSYSRRADREIPASDGSILALAGTQVDLHLRTDRTVLSGRLEGLASGPVLLKQDGQRSLRGSLVVERPGSYHFVLSDEEGRSWRSRQAYSVQVEPDEVPRVRLERPAQDQVVRRGESVDLLFDAQDDFGLTRVQLVWRILGRGRGEQSKGLWRTEARGKNKHRQQLRWDLAELQLEPGEQIQFAIEAFDDDEVRGPKSGRSSARTFKIFSETEHHRKLMAQVRTFWERLLGLLADHLEGQPQIREQPESLGEHQALAKGLQDLETGLEKLRAELADDSLAWPPLRSALASQGRRLRDMRRNLDFLLRHLGTRAESLKSQQARSLADARERRVRRLEQDVLYLEDLLDMERLEDLERIGKELDRAQARLADLMARYRKAPSEEMRREIQAAIAQLKQQIARLMERQSEVIKSLRDEYLNPEALARMASERDMMGALDELQRKMNEGRLDEAMAEMQRLSKQLQDMRRALDQARSAYGQQRYAELAKKVSELRAELDQVAKAQQELARRSGEVRKKAMERLRKRLAARWPAAKKRLLQELDKVEKGLGSLGKEGVFGYLRYDRDMALERAKGLRQLLEADDLAASREEARRLLMYGQRLEQGLKSEAAMQRQLGSVSKALKAEVGRAEEVRQGSQEIAEALDRLMPEPEELLEAKERKQAGRMQQQQAELGQRMQAMERAMRQIDDKAPVFGPRMQLGLQNGRRFMQQAGSALRRRDVPGAWSKQQAALKALKDLQQSMEQAGKQCKQGGMPLPMGYRMGPQGGDGRGEMSREPVEIPQAEDDEGVEDFRKELMEGMRDPVPEEFKPQVRDYYEELVR